MQLGIIGWKPVLSALLLPPVPLLCLMLVGAGLMRRRPLLAWSLLLTGAAALWLSSTVAVGDALQRQLARPSHALTLQELQQLQTPRRVGASTAASASAASAIVVLGGGRESYAPEYGRANLTGQVMERLRYGLWLSRETALPVAFSGGVGHAQAGSASEADIAAQIAAREFGRPLKWTESSSRDTRENAERSVAMLRPAGVTHIVLVTHGWHMRRSLRAFEQAIERNGGGIELVAAPMGLARDDGPAALRWLPSGKGFRDTRNALHEMLGLLAGA